MKVDKDAKCTIAMHDDLEDLTGILGGMHGSKGAFIVGAHCPACRVGQTEVMCETFFEWLIRDPSTMVPCDQCGESTSIRRAIVYSRRLR